VVVVAIAAALVLPVVAPLEAVMIRVMLALQSAVKPAVLAPGHAIMVRVMMAVLDAIVRAIVPVFQPVMLVMVAWLSSNGRRQAQCNHGSQQADGQLLHFRSPLG